MKLTSLLSISFVVITLGISLPAFAEIIDWQGQDAIVPSTTNPIIQKGESVTSQPTEHTNDKQPKYKRDYNITKSTILNGYKNVNNEKLTDENQSNSTLQKQ
jgi:hypothetical protein